MNRFLKFAAVGACGFVIDAGLTVLLAALVAPEISRIPAFISASVLTYVLNRSWTYAANHTKFWDGYKRYLPASVLGALLNYAIFVVFINFVGRDSFHILAGVAIGAVIALAFNFYVSSAYVFRR